MRSLALVILGLLLLSSNAFAAGIDKTNSLTVENDPATNAWLATCDISVSGIEPNQVYSGVMLFYGLFGGGQTGSTIFSISFQVDSTNTTSTETDPGIYNFKARLKGKSLNAQAVVRFSSLVGGDRLNCDSRLDRGLPGSPTTLFGSNMAATVQQP